MYWSDGNSSILSWPESSTGWVEIAPLLENHPGIV